jgi:hypothetical protein
MKVLGGRYQPIGWQPEEQPVSPRRYHILASSRYAAAMTILHTDALNINTIDYG